MKFLVILDESEKIDFEEKGLIKESKPIFKEMLVGKCLYHTRTLKLSH